MDHWGGLFFGGVAEGKGPMHQFEIQRLVPIEVAGYDLSFTNSALWMVLVAIAATSLFTLAMSPRAMVPGRLQLFTEMTYTTIADMVRSTAGEKGMDFFPFVFSLFIFVLFANLFGMIPGSFTVTSHIIVTFALAAVVISLVVIYGFWKHGVKFLKLFVPDGVPILILPLIVLIELISFLSRPISLSVRLFANMLAGHTMLKVFAGFIVMLGATELAILGIAPLIAIVALTALEFLIAALQAYIFAILTCVYLADAIHLHGHADEHH